MGKCCLPILLPHITVFEPHTHQTTYLVTMGILRVNHMGRWLIRIFFPYVEALYVCQRKSSILCPPLVKKHVILPVFGKSCIPFRIGMCNPFTILLSVLCWALIVLSSEVLCHSMSTSSAASFSSSSCTLAGTAFVQFLH